VLDGPAAGLKPGAADLVAAGLARDGVRKVGHAARVEMGGSAEEASHRQVVAAPEKVNGGTSPFTPCA
jgi:hypothetical protein